MGTAEVTGQPTRLVQGLRWLSLGRSERVVWGRCQGSAREPYAVVVSAARTGTTSCTCPSRQRPCKHARGLAGLAADGQVAAVPEPDWVTAVADRRPFTAPETSDPAETGGSADGVVDQAAAAQRAQARRDKVDAGMAELQLWLADQVRAGLAGLPRAGYGHVEAIAARMVDAQAPGVAGTLRSLPADLVSADWPTRALHVLGGLHLLASAHARLDELPPELAATVRSRVGYPVTKDTVRAREPVLDRWWALGAVDTVEYQLTSRRVWLRGLDTGRWAMWLTFAPPGRDLDTSVQPGRVYACEARFYPGSGQHRVLLEPPLPDLEEDTSQPAEPVVPAGLDRAWGGDDLAGVTGQLAALLAEDPWASRVPAVISGVPVPPRHGGDRWRLRDATWAEIELADLDAEGWPLVAQAGGRPLQLMGEYDGRTLRPLAVLPDAEGRRYAPVPSG